VSRIIDFCICIYVFEYKFSLFRLCDSEFEITPVDDIAIGITWAAFCFHIARISFANSWYLFIIIIAFEKVPTDLRAETFKEEDICKTKSG
jgi:hypothetical protein